MTISATDTQVPAADLTRGMFVSGLDRPWTDTPYLIQGFLLETDEDILELRRHCQYVYIDRNKSTGNAYFPDPSTKKLLESDPTLVTVSAGFGTPTPQARTLGRPAMPPRPLAPRVAVNRRPIRMTDGTIVLVERITDLELKHLGARASAQAPPSAPPKLSDGPGLLGRLTGWFSRGERLDDSEIVPTGANDAAVALRPRVVVAYEERASLEDEVPRARAAIEQSRVFIGSLVSTVTKRGQIQVHQAKDVVAQLIDSMERNPNALLWLARLKSADSHAYSHSLQSAVYLVALGLHIGIPRQELAELSLAGLMLDIGKLRVPQEVLQMPRRLSPAEFEAVKRHVQYGLDILGETRGVPETVLRVVARHHEREDGSGYPHGLKTDAIGLHGRMAALTDSFVAMTNPRPYAQSATVHDALRMLYRWRDTQFHEPLIEQFVQAIGVYPVGTLVELSSGEVAVVVAHNRVRRMKPRVLLLTGPDKSKLSRPTPLDLLYAQPTADQGELVINRALPNGAFGVDATEFYLA